MAPRKTTNNHDEPADNTKTLPFECTYPDCIRRFATLKEMKRHKLDEPEHYYCKKCDVDCEDWEALTQHKVTAMSPWVDGPMRGNREVLPKHIVCEFCGMEYKTFGARRLHREQNHKAEQNVTCPYEECSIIFSKAAEFIRHLEDGRCKGVSATDFRAYLEQNHVNKQIMQDTTISDRLQANKAAADIAHGVESEDTETEYGGVSLPAPSLIDGEQDGLHSLHRPLEPERDLMGFQDLRSPTESERPAWPSLSSPTLPSLGSLSISSRVPSVAETGLSASEFAASIMRPRPEFTAASSRQSYNDAFPSLRSPTYAASSTSDATSSAVEGVKRTLPWLRGASSQVLFPDAKPTPVAEYDEDAIEITTKDLRQVRWWDPDHQEFEPDFFHSKDLMENRTFGCPFADCEDAYGYDTIDDLKAHLRHAHLTLKYYCPACHNKFVRPSALMAHAEANGNCKVQGSNMFKQLIADISGGFLKARRKTVPKIFRQDSKMVYEDGTPIDGILQTEFKPKMPESK